MDRYVWDGLVRACRRDSVNSSESSAKGFDERGINAGVRRRRHWHARPRPFDVGPSHSGQIQTYLGAVAVGMLALLLLYAWLA